LLLFAEDDGLEDREEEDEDSFDLTKFEDDDIKDLLDKEKRGGN